MEQNSSVSHQTFLEFLPVSFFGGVMGLCGLCFSWRLAGRVWHISLMVSETIGWLAVLAFAILTVAYLIKVIRHPILVRTELTHPVSVCFFATFIVSMLLIPGILFPYLPNIAIEMWLFATFLMLLFAWYVLRSWIDNQQLSENAVPAWVLPIVGTLDVPIIGNHLPIRGVHEICLVFFGIGIIFSIILPTIIISRLLFQKPLPGNIQPTLLILTGPFALAFTGYEGLTGQQDMIAAVFFYFNLFLLLLFGSKIFLLPKSCPFKATWWSVSFPLSAITIAAFHYSEHQTDLIHQLLAAFLLLVTSLVILYLLSQTLYRIWTGKFATLSFPG